jgi:hypothetical protein
MKSYFFYFAGLLSGFLISCNHTPSGPTAAQINLDAQKNIREAILSKNLDKLNAFIAPDCIDHSGDHGDVKGLDSIKMQIVAWRAMADEKTDLIKELADDQYVMSWEHNTGKYTTTGYGHRVGDTFDLQEIEVVRFRDGKAVEHWSMMPPADVMKMMATTAAPVTMDNAVIQEDSIRLKKKR